MARWLAIDTDAGVDDAVALTLALRSAPRLGFELRLLATTFGNVPLERVNENVAKCRRACGLGAADVPICVGAAVPVLGSEREVSAESFHGADGLGDATPPLPPGWQRSAELGLSTEPAVDALLRLSFEAQAAGAELHLIALGPLTNIALAV